MASLCGNLAVLLIFASPLMHSQLHADASTSPPPITRKKIKLLTNLHFGNTDYDYEDHSLLPEVLPSAKSPRLYTGVACDHDPCLEGQESCEAMKAKTGCLCPGRSGANESPHAPRIRALLPITEGKNTGKIEVQWCAPHSVVSSYKVIVEGNEEYEQFGAESRRGLVESLAVGTKVCVEAVNDAGSSSPSEFSCKRFERPDSSDHSLLAGVIGGGVTFILLLVIVAVVFCRKKICQKTKRESVNGLGNPSYKSERAT